jgi:hypothetical protein
LNYMKNSPKTSPLNNYYIAFQLHLRGVIRQDSEKDIELHVFSN